MISLIALLAGATPNLLVNGNFEAGFKGFTSEYAMSQDVSAEGTFYVGKDPHDYHGGAGNVKDHTTGAGQMLIVNGSPDATKALWAEKIKVLPHHTYTFVAWASSWGSFIGEGQATVDDVSPARLILKINGKPVSTAWPLDAKGAKWQKLVLTWKSGSATRATLQLTDENTDGLGNDFVIDDLSFRASGK